MIWKMIWKPAKQNGGHRPNRLKGGDKSLNVNQKTSESNKKGKDYHWWSKQKMDMEVGSIKGEAWRASGKLQTQSDQITGSTHEDLIEYRVPHHWESIASEDLHEFELATKMAATEADIELLADASITANPSSSSGQEIKQEGPSALDVLESKVTHLIENPREKFKELQDMRIEAEKIKVSADNASASVKNYAASLIADLPKHIAKLKKLGTLLDRMQIEAPDRKLIPELMANVNREIETHKQITMWAERFSLSTPAPKKRRKVKQES